jgi:hypothetical protein
MTLHKVLRFVPFCGQESRDELGVLTRSRSQNEVGDGDRARRLLRVAVGVPLDEPGFPAPPFAAVETWWFATRDEALAHGAATDVPGARVVVAEEVVARGEPYLVSRWRTGGERYVMLSFGKRHPSLTAAEFSARWRGEGGRLGGEQIPETVRGLAYVQNHPVLLDGHEWPLDAVNEVYFEDLDALRQRRDWFAARRPRTKKERLALRASGPPFMSPTEVWTLFVRQVVVSDAASASTT